MLTVKTPLSLLERLRLLLAVAVARMTALAGRLSGHTGTSLPGLVALFICPWLVGYLASNYKMVLAVTGTNGKTTTANLLAHFLRQAGYTVAHNTEGANMLPGVATALIRDCSLWGRSRSGIALLEVDEGSVGKIFPLARPQLVVVTNYFRDQLDRYWELERTINLLRSTLEHLPETTLVLNADDPLVAALAVGRKRVAFYGVNRGQPAAEPESEEAQGGGTACRTGRSGQEETREGRYCACCGTELIYRYFHYGQLGDYHCPKCGFRRPAPHLAAEGVIAGERLEFTLKAVIPAGQRDSEKGSSDNGGVSGSGLRFTARMRGFYNVYNILAASAASAWLGIPLEKVQQSLTTYRPALGRMERFWLGGRSCTLALIKNPAGVNQVLKTILSDEMSKSLVVAINDLAADGRDVSWLWDADFELLGAAQVRRIICSGLRGADLAVCLKYAGIPEEKLLLVPDRKESLKALAGLEGEDLYVLATYTNLFDYAKLLNRLGKGESGRAAENLPSVS